MYWEKEFRIRLTTRRIFGGILTTMSVVNLIIVGAVYNANTSAPTPIATSTQTTSPPVELTITPSPKVLIMPSSTPPHTETQTPSTTPTYTSTPTATYTLPPNPTQCAPRTEWPIYVIQRGDTLFSLARASCSSVEELMLANCLYDNRIYAGQILYVPCLPIKTPTITPSIPPTETDPPSTETNYPPTVTITKLAPVSYYAYDSTKKIYYIPVVLQGNAIDPEDGELYGPSLIWKIMQPGTADSLTLGEGTEVKTVLYSASPNGESYTITLTATDKDGNSSTATGNIFIGSEY